MMTVSEAILEAKLRAAAPVLARTGSHFLVEVHGADGTLKYSRAWRKNLTTDTAAGYTNRRDWQAALMGGGVAAVATMTGAATSVTATSLTNTGAAFPTSGNGLAGAIVAVGPNSAGTGSTVFGVIMSNSGTVLTIDQWYSAGTLALGTTPNGTCTYSVLPGQMPAMFLALAAGGTATVGAADTTLDHDSNTEVAASGLSRAVAAWAHTHAATTYTLTKVFTATGTVGPIQIEGVFSSLVAAKGAMPFESTEPSPPTLVNGDTLTQTITVTIN